MQPTSQPPARNKGWRIVLMVALAAAVFLLAPPLLRWLNPSAGAFDVGTLNAPVLAALQFFAAVSMAFVPWRFLFPGLYGYVRDGMEEKLLANITGQLSQALDADFTNIPAAAERRHIAQFQFLIRCVRLLFCLLPFLLFLLLAEHFLNVALTVVPH